MATPNKIEVTLTFKPLMDGLNVFTSGIKNRMQEVQAFNERINNGAAAINQIVSRMGALLGAAALANFARDAREADKVQAQLNQTLKRTGQTGALDAFNQQAAALQRLTLFTDEQVNSVQRLLVSFGLTSSQTQDLTELVLDFAQATGQSAEAAAMLIGRTLKGDSEEIGRFNLKISQTKDRVVALRDALRDFAGGSARGAVPDAAQRDVEARFEDAKETLGRAVNRIVVPFTQVLIPLMERVADVATKLASALAPIMPVLGDMAVAALPVIVALGLLRGAISALGMIMSPLRVAFVALAGDSFGGLSKRLDEVTERFGSARTRGLLLKDAITSLAGAGRLLALTFAGVGAAMAGFAAGKMLGTWLKHPEAIDQARAGDEAVLGAVDKAARIRSEEDLAAARKEALELYDRVAASMREEETYFRSNATAVEIYRQQLLALKTAIEQLGGATAQRTIALNQAADAAARLAKSEADAAAWIKGDDAAKLRDSIAESIAGRTDPNERLANARAMLSIHERTIATAQTEISAGRSTAQVQAMLLKNTAGRETSLKTIAALEREIATTTAEKAEQALNGTLRGIAARRADLEGNFARTDADKWPLRKQLIEEEIAAQKRYLDVLQAKHDATNDPAARASLSGQISGGLDKLSGLQNEKAQLGPNPTSFGENIIAAVTSAQTAVGSFVEQTARAFANVGESIRTSMGSALANMVLTAGTAREKLVGFAQSIGQAFVQQAAQMVADWIYSHVLMEGVRAAFNALGITQTATAEAAKTTIIEAGSGVRIAIMTGETGAHAANVASQVGVHAAGEAAKTGSTFMGAIGRKAAWLGETIFHGIQWVIRTGVHLAGEVANTAVTLAQTAIRLPAILVETGAYVAKAAAGALSAMASIPYVGPFLAIAAMVAILAAGAKLVSGFATGGLVEGDGTATSDSIPARLSDGEFVQRAAAVNRFGVPFMAALNAGILDLTALPGNVAASLASPDYAGSRATGSQSGSGFETHDLRTALQDFTGRINVVVVDNERAATRIARNSQAVGDVIKIVRDNLPEISRRGP